MPPECRYNHLGDRRAVWTVVDKTTGKVFDICHGCLFNLKEGHTYSIWPAKDYSKKKGER